MGIISKLIGGSIAEPIMAIGNVFDKLFTSDEEREKANIVLEKLRQHPAELQIEINKLEAQHRSLFVAGWRPFIGWICGLSLAYEYLIRPLISGIFNIPMPAINSPELHTLITALLGLGTLRTVEKFGNKTK